MQEGRAGDGLWRAGDGLNFDLVAEQVLKGIAAADEVCLAVPDEDFRGLETGIEIGGHLESVGAGIVENEIVTFANFIDGAVPGEGVGLADVADYRIAAGFAFRIADIDDAMVSIVEHGADEVIEAAVDADEGSRIGLFDDVDLCNEAAAFADQEFAGFEPYLEAAGAGRFAGGGPHCSVRVVVEGLFDFGGEVCDVRFPVPFFVGHLEAASQIEELKLAEFRDEIEEYFDAFYKYVDVLDLAAGMDMKIGDVEIVFFYEVQDLVDLLDGDAELAFIVTGGDLEVAAGHDVGAETDAYRVGVTEFPAELLQVGKAVDIDDDAERPGLFDLVEADAVGGIQDPVGREPGMKGQAYFVDRAAID